MGAIVTIKVRPGTNVRDLKDKLSRILKKQTGENVAFNITVASDSGYTDVGRQASNTYR